MSKCQYVKALFSSFYSRHLYRDVKSNWGANVILYMLLAVTIALAISLIPLYITYQEQYNKFLENVTSQLPEITITNGIVSTPENKPYLIKIPGMQGNAIIIDTSGEYTENSTIDHYLITKNALITQVNNQHNNKIEFAENTNFQVGPIEIKAHQQSFYTVIFLIFSVAVYLFSIFIYIVQAFISGAIGKFFSILLGADLPYMTIVKLCFVAATPAWIFSSVLDWVYFFMYRNDLSLYFNTMHNMMSFYSLSFFVISLIYTFFAVYVNKDHALMVTK